MPLPGRRCRRRRRSSLALEPPVREVDPHDTIPAPIRRSPSRRVPTSPGTRRRQPWPHRSCSSGRFGLPTSEQGDLVQVHHQLGGLEPGHPLELRTSAGTRPRPAGRRRPRRRPPARPTRSSGQPTTTAWRTPGCSSSTRSTSAEAMFSPARMISSFSRPTMVSQPSASRVPRSPVANQPRRTDARVWLGLAVADEQLGPPHQHLAGLPRREGAAGGRVDHPDLGLPHRVPVGVAGLVGAVRPRCWWSPWAPRSSRRCA